MRGREKGGEELRKRRELGRRERHEGGRMEKEKN